MGHRVHYAIRTEFQERRSPNGHSILWVLSTPNIENEAAYIEFIEDTKNAQLPDHFNNLELFELIKTYAKE